MEEFDESEAALDKKLLRGEEEEDNARRHASDEREADLL